MSTINAQPSFFNAVRSISNTGRKAEQSGSRIEMLDAARAFAAFVIVFNHTMGEVAQNGTMTFSFSVAFYLILALQMASRKAATASFSNVEYLGSRLKRLYPPFIFWFLFPTLVSVVEALLSGHKPTLSLQKGQAYHLYFLHLLVAGTVIFLVLRKMTEGSVIARRIVIGFLGVMALVLSFVSTPHAILEHSSHVRQTIYASWGQLPGLLVAIAIALASPGKLLKIRSTPLAWVGVAVCVVCVVVNFLRTQAGETFDAGASGIRVLGGIGFVLIALAPWRGQLLSILGWIGRHSFGIYLAHVAILRIVVRYSQQSGLDGTVLHSIEVASLVFLLALGITVLLSKSTWSAWIVGATSEASERNRQPVVAGAFQLAAA